MNQEVFNAAYYSTAAQVIPVFILAAAASRWWRKRTDDPWHINTMLVGVVLIALAGEAFAMKALQFQRGASTFENNVIGMAFGFPSVYVFLALAENQAKVMLQQLPPGFSQVGMASVGPLRSCVTVGVLTFGLDPALFIAIAGLALFLGPVWILMAEEWLGRKRKTRLEADQGSASGLPPP